VPDLVAAMNDSSSLVRNNAMRALMVFTRYLPKPPARKIQVPSQPLIALLNSCVWTDRNKSAAALAELTETRDSALLEKLRREAFPSLEEMERWKNFGHAYDALKILGRITGMTEEQLLKDLTSQSRRAIFAAAQIPRSPED